VTFDANAELFTSTPVVIAELAFDGGTEYYCSVDFEAPAPSEFYSGRVISFGTLTKSTSDITGSFQISEVTLTLSNTDNKFSTYDLEEFVNRIVNYKLGFLGDTIANFKNIFTGKIYDFEYSDSQLILSVEDYTATLLEKDYGHYVVEADWPRAAEGVIGARMPIIYGTVAGSPTVPSDLPVGG